MKESTSLAVSILFIGSISLINAAAPVSFTIPSVIHDVYGCDPNDWSNPPPNGLVQDADHCSPDVQTWLAGVRVPGMVENRLKDKKLVYREEYWTKEGQPRQATNATTFDWLWNPGPRTFDINYDFVLTNPNPDVTDVYTYDNQKFFPIDNRGWGNTRGYGHNFGFCMESHSVFTFRGGEVFNFSGDDDLWIFVDNRLAMDIGGVHIAVAGTIKLDEFPGLYKGATYNFDIFYCERRIFDSTIKVQSTIAIYCPPDQIDYCGVCQGTGTCCPNACVPKDKCHIATRNAKTCECVQNVDQNKKFQCDSKATKCETYSCNANTGDCSVVTLIPDTNPSLNNSCHNTYCDPKIGWRHEDKRLCDPVNCKLDNACVAFPSLEDPSKDYHCKFTNSCVTAYCSNNNITCPDSNSKCYDNFCSDIVQGCIKVYRTKPDATDNCTISTCDDATGSWQYSPKNCSSDNCSFGSCNPSTGECTVIPKPCDDLNNCTQNLCHPENGTCYYPPIDLIALQGSDSCLTVTCNPDFGGIIYTKLGVDVPCPNADRCKPDPTVPGCCVCKSALSVAAIAGITAGAIAGAVIGAIFLAALIGVGGKMGYDYLSTNAVSGTNIQNNPLC